MQFIWNTSRNGNYKVIKFNSIKEILVYKFINKFYNKIHKCDSPIKETEITSGYNKILYTLNFKIWKIIE